MEEITIVDVPPMTVIGIQKTGTYSLIPELIMKVCEHAVRTNAGLAGPPIFICHETSPEAVKEANEKGSANVEIAWPVSNPVKSTGEFRSYQLPGGKMVRTVYRGPYEGCEPAYLRLFEWIREHDLQIAGPIREMYPSDPREVKPEDIITEIYVPVR
jgi:AraC family transcriptional regulator